MKHFTHRVRYHAPIELVYARATDPDLMPRYWSNIVKVWDVSGRPEDVGSTFRFRSRILGRQVDGRSEVVAADPPRLQTAITTYDNGTRVRWTMRMAPADGETDVVNDVDYEVPSGLLFAVLDRLVLGRTFRNTLVEGDPKFEALLEAELAAPAA